MTLQQRLRLCEAEALRKRSRARRNAAAARRRRDADAAAWWDAAWYWANGRLGGIRSALELARVRSQ